MSRSAAGAAQPGKRDAAASKRRILQAALEEFCQLGHDGARVDTIAERAGVSKPMIYAYFGNKDDLYREALREAYVQIRRGERQLDTEAMAPEQAVRAFVQFTMDHFVLKPWFIAILNTENLRGGRAVRQIVDAADIQSPLIAKLGAILDRGVQEGRFRAGIDPVEFYITIASLCYFPVSNRHTLSAVFETPLDKVWLDRHVDRAADMLLRYLAP